MTTAPWNSSLYSTERNRPSPGSTVLLVLRRPSAVPSSPPDLGLNLNSVDDLRAAYDTHGAELFRYCGRLLGDHHHAEEAVQETFTRAWRKSDQWNPALGSLRTWLFAIAHNVAADMRRARDVRPKLTMAGPPGQETVEPATGEDEISRAMNGWMIDEALRRIRDDQRRAIVETYVRGRPYVEVAIEFGVPEGTLRSRVFYGLKALRLALEEMGWGEG